jgi:hypothetical protein
MNLSRVFLVVLSSSSSRTAVGIKRLGFAVLLQVVVRLPLALHPFLDAVSYYVIWRGSAGGAVGRVTSALFGRVPGCNVFPVVGRVLRVLIVYR